MKIVTIEEVKERINARFPGEPYEIIKYTKMTEPFTIRCLKCNEVKTFSTCGNFLTLSNTSRKHLCSCYNPNSQFYKHQLNRDKILELCKKNDNIEFINFDYRDKTRKHTVNVLCKKCGQTFNKDWESFLNNQTCPYCHSKHDLNTEGFKAILPQDYELVNEYVDTETKVLIRHKCGFIWNIKPHNFIQKINTGYYGCPQCNHKRSRGEMKITRWLQEKNIDFIEEQIFSWSSNSKFRYDFYLPKINLIIEYMGEQHYKEVNFFHDTLAERQQHDKIKEQEAREHGIKYLIIPYTEFKNIEQILQDWFNDYSERK